MQLFALRLPRSARRVASDGPVRRRSARQLIRPTLSAFQAALNAAHQNARGASNSRAAASNSNKNQNSTNRTSSTDAETDLDAASDDEMAVSVAADAAGGHAANGRPRFLTPQAAPVPAMPAVSLAPSAGGTAEDGATTPLATAGRRHQQAPISIAAGAGQGTAPGSASIATDRRRRRVPRRALQGADDAWRQHAERHWHGHRRLPPPRTAPPVTIRQPSLAAPQASARQTPPPAARQPPVRQRVSTDGLTSSAPARCHHGDGLPQPCRSRLREPPPRPRQTAATTVPATGIGAVDALAQGAAAAAQALSQAATAPMTLANAQADRQQPTPPTRKPLATVGRSGRPEQRRRAGPHLGRPRGELRGAGRHDHQRRSHSLHQRDDIRDRASGSWPTTRHWQPPARPRRRPVQLRSCSRAGSRLPLERLARPARMWH